MSDERIGTDVFILIGLVLVIPVVVWMTWRSHLGAGPGLLRAAFAAYVVVLVGLLFTPFPIPPWSRLPVSALDTGYRPWPFPWVNIVPFETVGVALRYGLDWQPGRVLVGNVLAFVPLGVFLPSIWPRWRSLVAVVGAALVISVAVETMQVALSVLMGFPYRVADIDDVIINVLGVALGYGLYRAIALLLPRDQAVQPAT